MGRSAGEGIDYPLQYSWASLVAQLVKNLLAIQEAWFNPYVRKIPWRREQLSIPVFWPGEFHGLYGVAKNWTRLSDFSLIQLVPQKAVYCGRKTSTHLMTINGKSKVFCVKVKKHTRKNTQEGRTGFFSTEEGKL